MTSRLKTFRIEAGLLATRSAEVAQEGLDALRQDRARLPECEPGTRPMRTKLEAIDETRRQLAALQVGSPHELTIGRMGSELDAVVMDAAEATNAVLDSVEAMQEIIEGLRGGVSSPQATADLDRLARHVVSLLETCNFQDLTGQRIGRVVEKLGEVERRIARLTDVWGGQESLGGLIAEQAARLAAERETEGSFQLASGPQLIGQHGHVDQDDIDRLFN